MTIPATLWSSLRENLGRALLIAVVVGTVLLMINHGDHIEKEPICTDFWTKCGLTYLVPFLVSMVSVALAFRQNRKRNLSKRNSS